MADNNVANDQLLEAPAPQPDMSLVDITDGENERKIPRVKFPEDVEAFANSFEPAASAELLIGAYTELHNKFKSFEANLEKKKSNYLIKIPDLEKSLALVNTLQRKKQESETAITRYNLCESVYGKAEIDTDSSIVNLWLGANVMLEYTYSDATEFLTTSLATHRSDFQTVKDDLTFVRDQIVTCEVCMTRTYNWSVRKRRTLS